MNTKKKYIILSLTILLLGFGLIGVTFAWYSYSNASSNVSGKTIKDKPSIVFANTEYIENDIIMPINDDDRYNYGTKNSFIITIPEKLKKYDVSVAINLINVQISDELKSNEYKYELLENNLVVASGDFSSLEEDKLEILSRKLLNTLSWPYSYNYELIIWLSDTGSIQNDLMNKQFKAKVNVISAVKKR